jgi:cell division protein FtsZ
MSTLGLPFAAINTDWRALEQCAADRKLPISEVGLGAGANPIIGEQAAEEAVEAIATLCRPKPNIRVTRGNKPER